VTEPAAPPPAAPLPIRPRPASGESTASYIRRLAVANHLRPVHLRRYLKDPGNDDGIRLSWLAILAGRPVTSLQHALAGQLLPPGDVPARNRLPGARQQKPSRAGMPALAPRNAREHGLPARSAIRPLPLCCSFCSKDKGSVARLVAGPGVCICNECIDQCTQTLATKAMPEIAAWHERPNDELLASLPRLQAVALQVDADMQDRVDTLRDRGVSWARIGAAFGVSRQAAWMRFSGEDRP